MNTKRIAISAAVLMLLAGCGGGGGGSTAPAAVVQPSAGLTGSVDSSITNGLVGAGGSGTVSASGATSSSSAASCVATTTSVPIDSAISNLYVTGTAFARQDNTVNGAKYGFTATYSHGNDGTFEGINYKTAVITREVTKDGVLISSTSQTDYFKTGPFGIAGRIYSPSSGLAANYYVTDLASQKPLPDFGTPCQTGTFYNATIYTNSSKTIPVGTAVQTWDIRVDTDTSNLFCITSTTTLTTAGSTSKQQECYRIDKLGKINSVFYSLPG